VDDGDIQGMLWFIPEDLGCSNGVYCEGLSVLAVPFLPFCTAIVLCD
jgi:hypothetical protein